MSIPAKKVPAKTASAEAEKHRKQPSFPMNYAATFSKSAIASAGRWLSAGLGCLAVSLLLAWVSTGFQNLQGWVSFLILALLSAGLLWLGWRAVEITEGTPLPQRLAILLLAAAGLRLAAGVLWFILLPGLGHGSEGELAGYVMADAWQRDGTAWQLAHSGAPMWTAFTGYRIADQYGGLLFISTVIYRYLGSAGHQPLLIVLLAAALSASAVLFTWAFARRAFSSPVAWIAAGLLALYPEAVLLGSTQMREAFLIPITAAAFYGLFSYAQRHSWVGVAWIIGAILAGLPISPPYTILLLAALVITALFTGQIPLRGKFFHRRGLWAVLGVLLLLGLAGLWAAWQQFAPDDMSNPVSVILWWIKKSAEWQAHLAERSSGKIQALFDRVPGWLHIPILLGYGVVQPFLPAAIIARSESPIWYWIAIWRSSGWTLMLPLVLYATLRAWDKKNTAKLPRVLGLLVWIVILIASFRAGGDQWDNVRYRTTFIGLQVVLAAWAFYEQRREPDPWFRRAVVGVLLILAWFLPWYLWRYFSFDWPVKDVLHTIGLGIASALIYALIDRARMKQRKA